MVSSAPVAAGSTPYASSGPISSSSPVAAGSSPYADFRDGLFTDELPADELTAVFAPPAELLARSGRQPAPGSAWDEATQIVHMDDVARARPSAPPHAVVHEGPTREQLDFERSLVALATPIPAPPQNRRWLLWAVAAVLGGAAAAALAEYSLHPARPSSPSPAGVGVAAEPR